MMRTTETMAASAPAGEQEDRRKRQRVVLERLRPEIDGGRHPIKRTAGEEVRVTVDMFADGHDVLAGVLLHRRPGGTWREVPLTPLDNDAWEASFAVEGLGMHEYTAEGWVDRFGSWLKGLIAKAEAGQDVSSELLEGAELVRRAADRRAAAQASRADERSQPQRDRTTTRRKAESTGSAGPGRTPNAVRRLLDTAETLRSSQPQRVRVAAARDAGLKALMDASPDRAHATRYGRVLAVIVDPVLARYGAWYEMFPRSCTPDPSRGATLREAEARLPEIADMNFDVVYLSPIHPIGRTHRKGRNNTLTAGPGDPGSPWAIGAEEGGHTAVHPELGTIDDFDRFVRLANRLGMEVALDIAFQASPDHPWVREHPEWFKHRPDGTIKYAENPPKKYQDIYPFDFETAAWQSLWNALRDIFLFWAAHGVTVFRVDNPHTKPFAFWEWCIAEVRRRHPEAIFLSEAFTRPKVMRYLARIGFSQSYTYFTWRNQAAELRDYLTELTRTELQEYMRPNLFVNTPDILNEYLVTGGRPAFEVRLVLAATLAASYGIYSGYELCENVPVRPGSEEYLDSEKYQIKPRDYHAPGSLTELIARINEVRREHPALQQNATLAFYGSDNPQILAYGKTAELPAGPDAPPEAPRRTDRVYVVASTDPHRMQHGWVQFPAWEMGLGPQDTYVVEDQVDGAQYTWRGEWNYVRFEPSIRMAHVFVVRR